MSCRSCSVFLVMTRLKGHMNMVVRAPLALDGCAPRAKASQPPVSV